MQILTITKGDATIMNKFIAKVFKSAGVNAKVSKDSENPRFKVTEN